MTTTTMDWGDTGRIGHERLDRLLRDIRGGMVGTTELAKAEGTNRKMIGLYLARFRPLRQALALARMRVDWHPDADDRCPTCDGTGWPVVMKGETDDGFPATVRHRCEDCEGLRTRWWARTPDDLPASYWGFLGWWALFGWTKAIEMTDCLAGEGSTIVQDSQYRLKLATRADLRAAVIDWLDSPNPRGAY